MKLLTFDIEDWYNCDFIDNDFNWDRHEVRIYESVQRILDELERRKIRGTFFCLGWLAEKHPDVIKSIDRSGHHIGCHSYQHELSFRFTQKEFEQDTNKAKKLLEDITGKEVNAFRAPGFSITSKNLHCFETLLELGFKYDASVFPASHDYGGLPEFGISEPFIIETQSGILKEFPMNVHQVFNKNLVFSGGGFFRLLPYSLIKKFTNNTEYLMTYFHPRDFDTGQPVIKSLPVIRKFKSYVGIKGAFKKFNRYLSDYDFLDIEEADKQIDWAKSKRIKL